MDGVAVIVFPECTCGRSLGIILACTTECDDTNTIKQSITMAWEEAMSNNRSIELSSREFNVGVYAILCERRTEGGFCVYGMRMPAAWAHVFIGAESAEVQPSNSASACAIECGVAATIEFVA